MCALLLLFLSSRANVTVVKLTTPSSNPNLEFLLLKFLLKYLWLVVSYSGSNLLVYLSLDEMLFFVDLQI